MEQIKLKYEKNDFLRIDKYLNEIFEEFTRTQLQLMIEDGLVTVNDKVIKSNYKLKINDEIVVTIKDPELTKIEPQNIPLDIYYEDSDIIVVNKPFPATAFSIDSSACWEKIKIGILFSFAKETAVKSITLY